MTNYRSYQVEVGQGQIAVIEFTMNPNGSWRFEFAAELLARHTDQFVYVIGEGLRRLAADLDAEATS